MFIGCFKKIREQWMVSVIGVSAWWAGWALVAFNADLGLIIPGPYAAYNVCNYILFMWIGGLFYSYYIKPDSVKVPTCNKALLKLMIQTLGMAMLMIQGYLVFGTVELLSNGTSLDIIRSSFFSFGDQGNYWFKSKAVWSLYLILSGVGFHSLLILSFAYVLKYKEYTVVSFVVMYCVLDMLVKGGRGGVYSIVLCSVYAACVLVIWKEIVLSRKLLIAVSSLVGISSILLAFIGLARDGGAVGSGLTYHVVGFSLLSDLLENGTYYLSHDLTLGRLTFGGIDYFITALIRFIFDESYNTPVYLNVSIQNLPVLTMDSLSIIAREVNPEYYTYNTHNAFYTVLSTVYLDFGFMGAPLLGLITGVGLVRCEWLFRKESSYISVVFMIFIFYNSVTGIFASPLETPGFWGAALIIWFVSVVSSGNFLEKVRR